jgi:choline dehydrogenase-like flavoprotein
MPRNTSNSSVAINVKARREIIMAAGAHNTPQTLQLSGIGPKQLLSSLGIKTVVDLPGVGMNFQDQPTLYMQYSCKGSSLYMPKAMLMLKQIANTRSQHLTGSSRMQAGQQSNCRSTSRIAPVCQTTLHNRYKPLTSPTPGVMTIPYFGGSAVAFLPLQNVTTDYQDIIISASITNLTTLLPSNIDLTIKAGYQAQSNILLDLYKSPHAAVEEVAWEGGNTVCVAMIRPLSRGSILINTTDPTKPPVLNFGTFSHPTDLEVAFRAVRKVREWMASTPMQDVGAYETFPGTNVSSDDEIANALRQAEVSSWQHPTSTCSMLKRELGGVVDSELRVYGVKGLRIVDASIFPMAVAGHTSSTVYAVAEKVSLAFVLIDVMDSVLTAILRSQAADIIKAAQK